MTTFNLSKFILRILFLFVLVCIQTHVIAATKTFTGTGNFSTPARWGGALPVAGDNLVIDGNCTFDNSANNLAYGTLTVGNAVAGLLNWPVGGTNTLNVTVVTSAVITGTIDMTNGGTLKIRTSWTTTNQTFTPGIGTIHWNYTLVNSTLPAAITTYYNLRIETNTSRTSLGVNTVVSNNLTVTSGTFRIGAFDFTCNGTATIGGTLDDNSLTGSISFNNLSFSSGSQLSTTVAETINISGNLTIAGATLSGSQASTLNVSGDFYTSGSCTIGVVTLSVVGTTSVSGTFNNTSTTGTKTFNNIIMASGSSWSNSQAENFTINGNMTMNGGTLTGSTNGVYSIATGSLIINSNQNNIGRAQISAANTVVTSTLIISNANGTKNWGNLLINGIYNATVAAAATISGDFTNNGTFTSNTGTYLFSGTNKTISGTSATSIATMSISGSYVNTSTLTVTTGFSGGGSFAQGTNSTLSIQTSTIAVTSFSASVVGNTVNFSGAAQTVRTPSDGSYHSIEISGSNTKTLAANTILNGNLTISAGTLSLSGSVFSMSVAGNWSNTGGSFSESTGTVTFNGSSAQTVSATGGETFNNLIITSAGGVTLGSDITILGNLTFDNTLDASSSDYNITIAGTWTNGGTFTPQNGLVTFNGSSAQTIGGSSITKFYNLTISNAMGVSITSDQQLEGTLSLSSGTFTTTGFVFTLLSTASGTARIAAIPGGADIVGDITMQRYLSANSGWKFLGSPVSGATLSSWDDDMLTAGFTGTDYPTLGFVSIYSYDETVSGALGNGYTAPTNITNPIVVGQGYWVYADPLPITVDISGPPNKNAVPLPVTYSVSAGDADDGWNLVANPYPSSIDWDNAGWTKTNLEDAVYIYNEAVDNYATYILGSGTNGGSAIIPSSQAFWVKANNAAPALSAVETVKSATDQAFLKTNSNSANNISGLKLKIQGNSNFYDETVVRFLENASDTFDSNLDARKLYGNNPAVPFIHSRINGSDYSINSLTENFSTSIPLRVKVGVTGTYTIINQSIQPDNSMCLQLKDLKTNQITTIDQNLNYSFHIEDTTQAPRFLIIVTANVNTAITNPSCYKFNNGKILASIDGQGPFDVIWKKSSGDTIQSNSFLQSTTDSLLNLTDNTYEIIANTIGCSASKQITIISPDSLYNTSVVNNESCYGTSDGSIALTGNGGTLPYNYLWSDSTTQPSLNSLSSGNYLVTLTDANGCLLTSSYSISSPQQIVASFSLNNDSLFINNNDILLVTNQSTGATDYAIYFGDGDSLHTTTASYSHQYDSAGLYTLVLIAKNGICSSSDTTTITVINQLPNSIGNNQNINTIKLVSNAQSFEILNLDKNENYVIKMIDVAGKLIYTTTINKEEKASIKHTQLSHGLYYIFVADTKNNPITLKGIK